jgi:hypothetical protein
MCSEFNMQKIVAVSMETKKRGGLYNFFYDFSKHDVNTTLCDKVCQWLATGWWFSSGIPVSNKSDCHDIAEILLKEPLNTITLTSHNFFA